MKLGSLFDGSGGFPLAAALFGIEPVFASEIEPFPIRVTKQRFPGMKHLGSVTDVHGDKVEPVDIITFGSPCQDLSVAGKQAGIHEGERSSLFFEAMRIIKEMRNATANKFPRFAVWENVPGAFSSNKGGDFRAVLQAFCEAGGADVSVPEPPKGGWTHAGTIVGKGFSLAWRLYDAQFWGVPQRRKRIYLIADFGSERAGEILFKREGVSGDSEPGGEKGEGTAGDAAGGAGGGYISFGWANSGKAGLSADVTSPTLKAARCGEPGVAYSLQENAVDRDAKMNGCGWCEDVCYTLDATDRHAVCFQQNQRDEVRDMGEKSGSLTAQPGAKNQNYLCIANPVAFMGGQGAKAGSIAWKDNGKAPTLRSVNSGTNQVPDVCYTAIAGEKRETFVQPCFGQFMKDDKAQALKASDGKRVDPGAVVLESAEPPRKYIVRRLTPMECGRLQGFPDWWVDGAEGSDSAIYKMWGNGIALPCAADVIGRLAKELDKIE